MITHVFLVRHGLAERGGGCAVGHLDPPLSDEGAASVRRLAASWQGPPPDAVFASDLRRASETARLLAEAWGLSVEAVEADARLREMSFGEWEGRPWKEIETADAARFAAWSGSWWSARAPGGEGYPDLASRVQDWLTDLLAGPPGRTVVAVAHDGSIRALLAQAGDLPREKIFHLQLDHAHVSGIFGNKVLFVNAARFPATPI